MGDGVNIAARLEGVAEPGAICLSEDAYRQVKGRLDLAGARSRRDRAQEHRRAGARLLPATSGRRPKPPDEPVDANLGERRIGRGARQAVDRGSAFRQHERRRRAGIFRRRHLGRHHHVAVEASAAVRHRAQFLVHLQGQERPRRRSRQEPRRALHPRRQRAQIGRPGADHVRSLSTRPPAGTCGPSGSTASSPTFSRCRTT